MHLVNRSNPPRPENKALEPYAGCGFGQARELGRTLTITGRSAQLTDSVCCTSGIAPVSP